MQNFLFLGERVDTFVFSKILDLVFTNKTIKIISNGTISGEYTNNSCTNITYRHKHYKLNMGAGRQFYQFLYFKILCDLGERWFLICAYLGNFPVHLRSHIHAVALDMADY